MSRWRALLTGKKHRAACGHQRPYVDMRFRSKFVYYPPLTETEIGVAQRGNLGFRLNLVQKLSEEN